jgi:murein DD-endopeptidase MepM/ murein hydrolase activator NlpD
MSGNIDWNSHQFLPVVHLPDEYEVRDFTKGIGKPPELEYSIGRYDEVRPGMYVTDLFEGERFIHIGVDVGGPIGTACMAFAAGEIVEFGYNPEAGDYGHVVITHHRLNGVDLWALYGHLDKASIEGKIRGQKVAAGEVIGWFGRKDENGGWPPHLHFQLSLIEPVTHDFPGVVSPEERAQALLDFPDPRLVMGPIY